MGKSPELARGAGTFFGNLFQLNVLGGGPGRHRYGDLYHRSRWHRNHYAHGRSHQPRWTPGNRVGARDDCRPRRHGRSRRARARRRAQSDRPDSTIHDHEFEPGRNANCPDVVLVSQYGDCHVHAQSHCGHPRFLRVGEQHRDHHAHVLLRGRGNPGDGNGHGHRRRGSRSIKDR